MKQMPPQPQGSELSLGQGGGERPRLSCVPLPSSQGEVQQAEEAGFITIKSIWYSLPPGSETFERDIVRLWEGGREGAPFTP